MVKKEVKVFKINLSTTPIKNHTIYVIFTFLLLFSSLMLTFNNIYETKDILSAKKEASKKLIKLISDKNSNDEKIKYYERKIKAVKTDKFIKKCEFINAVVGKRIFSWTQLFNEIEKVLPNSVRLTQIVPDISKDKIKITLEVVSQNLESFLEFLNKLDTSKVFKNIRVTRESNNKGILEYSLSVEYKPPE